MGVHTALCFGLQGPVIRLQTGGVAVHRQCAPTIGDVHTMGAILFHQPGLCCECFWRGHVTHHQEARNVHAQFARRLDMLSRDIGFCAVRGDSNGADAQVVGELQIVYRADARNEQRGKGAAL